MFFFLSDSSYTRDQQLQEGFGWEQKIRCELSSIGKPYRKKCLLLDTFQIACGGGGSNTNPKVLGYFFFWTILGLGEWLNLFKKFLGSFEIVLR